MGTVHKTTPKSIHHRKMSADLHFQKTLLSMIYKLFSSLGPLAGGHIYLNVNFITISFIHF